MKTRLMTFLLAMICSSVAMAQSDAITRFFSDYIDRDNVTNINVSGSLFRMMSDASDKTHEQDDFMQMAGNITGIRIIVDNEDQNARKTLGDAAVKLSGAYENMMSIRDQDGSVEMYINERDGVVSEMVLAVAGSNNFVIMSIRGTFKLDDLGKLSSTVADAVVGDAFSANKVQSSDFKIWPNPVKQGEKVSLAVPNDMLGASLNLIDANGRIVHTENINQIEKVLNLSKLKPGMYVVKMNKGEVDVSKKLVIQ